MTTETMIGLEAKLAAAERDATHWRESSDDYRRLLELEERKRGAAEARAEKAEAALRSIAADECTNYRESGRSCEWLGQKWPEGYCYPCIARAALAEVGK